jgi:hypothetical protein
VPVRDPKDDTEEKHTVTFEKIDEDYLDMRWCDQSYFSPKLIGTLFRPTLRFFLSNV